jgi:hypothetical protein
MEEYRYPLILPQKRTGEEKIDGIKDTTLLDFWQWAYSNVVDNAERGIFAEWIVTKALNGVGEVRNEWDKYDILTPEGIKVEVKSSGYLQSWGQKDLSKIVFGIRQTKGWNNDTATYDIEFKRQSDVYVFCVHKHTDQATINPLDISQWDFYVLDTKTINEKMEKQKCISLSKLKKIGAALTEYTELRSTVIKLAKEGKDE